MSQIIIAAVFMAIIADAVLSDELSVKDVSEEIAAINHLVPLVQSPYIMLWRPQKVGSSTIESLLISYAYRYNVVQRRRSVGNSFCFKIAKCASEVYGYLLSESQTKFRLSKVEEAVQYRMVFSHQLCNLTSDATAVSITCAFRLENMYNSNSLKCNETKEIFVVRDPLSRLISVYYFYGELYRAWRELLLTKPSSHRNQPQQSQLFSGTQSSLLNHPRNMHRLLMAQQHLGLLQGLLHRDLFKYHGNESSVPATAVAIEFANKLPYFSGMPGPSFTWSAFSNSANDAIGVLKTDRLMAIVIERLDESLVVTSHYMNWTLADVVVTLQRKALSTHPNHTTWPRTAVDSMTTELKIAGEYAVYHAAEDKLNRRIAGLKSHGIDVAKEVKLLQALRARVTKLCLSEEYLERYRQHLLKEGYKKYPAGNRLRDVADSYVERGHVFSFNGDILCSFDVCGSCEAHALLLGVRGGDMASVDTAPTLKVIIELLEVLSG